MKMELKPTAILVATLAVGVVLGMVGQGMLMQDRSRRVQALRRPPGFISQLEDAIRPTEEQRDSVHKLLELAAARNDAIYKADRIRLGAALDTMRLQLAPLLDKEQQARLAQVSQLPDPNRPPRQDGPRRDDRPPRDEQPQAGDRPRNDQPPNDAQQGGDRPPRDGSRDPGPPRNDRPPRDRSQGDRPPRDRPQGDRPPGDRPPRDAQSGERPPQPSTTQPPGDGQVPPT